MTYSKVTAAAVTRTKNLTKVKEVKAAANRDQNVYAPLSY